MYLSCRQHAAIGNEALEAKNTEIMIYGLMVYNLSNGLLTLLMVIEFRIFETYWIDSSDLVFIVLELLPNFLKQYRKNEN